MTRTPTRQFAAAALAGLLLALAAALAAAPVAAQDAAQDAPPAATDAAAERGARLYLTGEGLRATIAGGAALPSAMAACVRCHRPSGYGGGESDARAPAIAAPVLFAPLTPRRALLLRDLYQERYGPLAKMAARTPRSRPAYAGARDLARALRDGVDPAGAALAATMPRYAIADADAAALTAYLRRLGATPDPGHDARSWTFATVITPDAPEAQVAASLAVIDAYVTRRNGEIARELGRPGFSPGYKGEYADARRLWRVAIWRLSGPPEGWAAQLAARYEADPPFALLGGVVPRDWAVVGAFCDAVVLPCIFPQTDWPGPAAGGMTLHLSGGLAEEATLMAAALRAMGARRVAMVAGAGADARLLARRFALANPDFARVAAPEDADAAALFLSAAEAEAFVAQGGLRAAQGRAVAAGGLLADARGGLAPSLACALHVAWRFAPPDATAPQRRRLRGWLRSRGVADPAQERAQLETWLALEAADHAIVRLVDRPSRALFVETIEHMAEAGLDPGVYPRFSLGPGQRVAARGAAMLRPDAACAAQADAASAAVGRVRSQ